MTGGPRRYPGIRLATIGSCIRFRRVCTYWLSLLNIRTASEFAQRRDLYSRSIRHGDVQRNLNVRCSVLVVDAMGKILGMAHEGRIDGVAKHAALLVQELFKLDLRRSSPAFASRSRGGGDRWAANLGQRP